MDIKYSIIVVCLNSGNRLKDTVESILAQTYSNYEIVVKDGGSHDGSTEFIKASLDERIRYISKEDSGIYDAMNQAIEVACGDYYIFLNTGDLFYDEQVLEKITHGILDKKCPDIVYGNMYHKAMDTVIFASPSIDDFTCYRNVPCHQTCFYSKKMFEERGYNPKYNVRADYEHFLWCYYEAKARIVYIPEVVAIYEGGGYSETKENKRLSAKQHREIVVRYMGKKKADKYQLVMWLTLAPLRTLIAQSSMLSGVYNAVKRAVYNRRR